MQTILEKCGITDRVIKNLKKRGLVVPIEVKPFKKVMKSPSEYWFYYVADRYTPPFTKKERGYYIKNPEQFCKDLIKSTENFKMIAGTLYNAFENSKKLHKDEAFAAVLAIMRIFHAAIERIYLKYDRHLEYHDYKESPVGFHWLRLRELCMSAAREAKVANPRLWVDEKILQVFSGYGIVKKSQKSKRISYQAYDEIKGHLKEGQIKELDRLFKIFKLFSAAQEKEGIIFEENLPGKDVDILRTHEAYFNTVMDMIKKNPGLVEDKNRNKLNKILKEETLIIQAKKLMYKCENCFSSNIKKLYQEELKRWL